MIGSTSSWGRRVMARHMALAGYVNHIITIETGLTYKQIRKILLEIENDGLKLQRDSRAVRGSSTIIQNHADKLQASLLMQLYENIGGADVARSVNVAALNTAYRMYHAIRNELPGMQNHHWPPFSITDAWGLAAELRSGRAELTNCRSCSCNYFTSDSQRAGLECPYCAIKIKCA